MIRAKTWAVGAFQPFLRFYTPRAARMLQK